MDRKILSLLSLFIIINSVFAFNILLNETNSSVSFIDDNLLLYDTIILTEDINTYKNKEVKEIKLNGNQFDLDKGINSIIKLKSKLLTKNEKTYAIIQFNKNPSKDERLELEKSRLLVFDYISSNSYYVSIDSDLDKIFETDSNNDYYIYRNSLFSDNLTGYTIGFWRNPSSWTTETYEALYSLQEINKIRTIAYRNENNLNVVVGTKNGITYYGQVLTVPLSTFQANSWTHFLLKWNGNKMYLYSNATLIATATTNGVSSTSASANPSLSIGSNQGIPTYSFNGKIDEFTIWNKSLSLTDIQNLYEEGIIYE